jgi:hypothetical protein
MNETGNLFTASTQRGERIYNLFDLMMLWARLAQRLHPTVLNCWAASEVTYNHFYNVLVVQNGNSPKAYLMNMVYNFGHIFDALRDVYLFFTQDPRGLVDNVHDTGYMMGLAVYLIITPDIAEYDIYNQKQ